MSQPVLKEITVKCSCGDEFVTKLPVDIEELKVEICSSCHPFYTKEQKIIDTEGTINAFNRRYRKQESEKS